MRETESFLSKERALALGTSRNKSLSETQIMSKISKDEFDFDKYYLTRASSGINALQNCSHQVYNLISNKIASADYRPLDITTSPNKFIAKHIPGAKKLDQQYRTWRSQVISKQINLYAEAHYAAQNIFLLARPKPQLGMDNVVELPESGYDLLDMQIGCQQHRSTTAAIAGAAMKNAGTANGSIYRDVMSVFEITTTTGMLPIKFNLRTAEYSNNTVTGPFKLIAQDSDQHLVYITGTYVMRIGGQGSITNVKTHILGDLTNSALAEYEPQIKHQQYSVTIPTSFSKTIKLPVHEHIDGGPSDVIVDIFSYDLVYNQNGDTGEIAAFAILPR